MTYAPIVAIFGMALALAIALSWAMHGAVAPGLIVWRLLDFATALLAVQKLREVEALPKASSATTCWRVGLCATPMPLPGSRAGSLC